MLIKVPVLDRDDGGCNSLRDFMRGELIALEDTAAGKCGAVIRLDHNRICRGLEHQSTVQRQCRDAILEIADRKEEQDGREYPEQMRESQARKRHVTPAH